MKAKFDNLSAFVSKKTTQSYSTSFSLGIMFLDKEFRAPVYAVYGFVRFADEIVDSFHEYDKKYLLDKFEQDTYEAIEQKISLNPVLNSFQFAVNEYGIEMELIDAFLQSMEMDIREREYSDGGYKQYILGSAEVVGLMCLRIFVRGDISLYNSLKPYAMKLGSAFQKVNFLRDIKADYNDLGRSYFPGVNIKAFSMADKRMIEKEIDLEFKEALSGIRMLPFGSRRGVYLAYFYYKKLFLRIKRLPVENILNERVRISNGYKFLLMINSYLRHQLNML